MNWAEFILNASLWVLCFFKFFVGLSVAAVTCSSLKALAISLSAGFSGITFFFFLSEYFMNRALKRRVSRIESGIDKPKKKFTKMNKFMVRVKHKVGLAGIAFLTPTIFSIPVGAIIMAKFYKHKKWAYPSLLISMVIWGFAIVAIARLFPDFFKLIFPSAYE